MYLTKDDQTQILLRELNTLATLVDNGEIDNNIAWIVANAMARKHEQYPKSETPELLPAVLPAPLTPEVVAGPPTEKEDYHF